MRDRTLDLQPTAAEAQSETQETKKKAKKPKKSQEDPESPVAGNMNQFFEEIAEVKEQIAAIKISIDEIRSIHDKTLNSVISEQQNAEIGRQLDAAMEKANKQSGAIRAKLKEMDSINKKLQKKDPEGNDTTIRISQHGVLTKNFLEVMGEYKKLQETYQSKFKDRMHRQALIVKPNATKEEIEKMVDGEQGQMFAKQIVNTAQRMEARKALDDIQNKHRDVVKIEKSILELQQLFMDMAVLVAAQGEVIDQIAVHVDSAVNDTEQGVQHLQKAVKIQKKTRKQMCIIIFLIIIVIGVIIVLTQVVGKYKLSLSRDYLPRWDGMDIHYNPRQLFLIIMRDRLGDLQSQETLDAPAPETAAPKSTSLLKKKTKKAKEPDQVTEQPVKQYESFFDQIASVKESISSIGIMISNLSEIQGRALNNSITTEQNQGTVKFIPEVSNEMSIKMDKIQELSKVIQAELKSIDSETKVLRGKDVTNQELPIRVSQHGVLLRMFLDTMRNYKTAQEEYQQKLKERMVKQALIVNPEATEKQVQEMIQEPVFAMKPQNTAQKKEAITALNEINRKHHEVTRITESILELQQLFLDVSVLVAHQGNQIDEVVKNVNSAVVDTEKGVEHMVSAVKTQRKTRKRMMCLACVLVITIALGISLPLIIFKK